MSGHHGRDQWQKLTLAAEKDGTVTGLKVDLLADLGAYVAHRRRRRAGARRVHVQRDLQVPGLPVQLPDGAHQQDLDRRLPRRRAPGGDVRHRAADGRARRRGRRRPARDPREELDQARGVPVHHGGRAGVRLRQLRGRHREGQGDVRVRRAAGRAEAAPRLRRPRAARHRRLDVHRDVRPGAVAGCSARSTTAPAAGSTRASGCWPTGKVEVVTGASAHGQGHETAFSQIVADRLGVAVRGRRGPARRHPGRPQGPGHLRLALAGRRRRGAGPGGRQGDREGQADRGPPARGRRSTTSSSPAAGSRSGAPTRGWRSARSRPRSFAAHNLPDGRRADHRLGGDVRPGELQLPARHPPVRDGGRHRDRAR